MNTTTNTERPTLKLNFGAKPLTLATNSNSVVANSKAKVGSNITKDTTKSETAKKSNKPADTTSNKVVVSPEEIIKAKIKRHKEDYQIILAKLQSDYPQVFSQDIKLLAIGIHLELRKILHGQFSRSQLGRFFHRYCGSVKYKEKLVEGSQRYNLDGSQATLVTKTEIPSIMHKPKFVKKTKNITDVSKTISNDIEPTQ